MIKIDLVGQKFGRLLVLKESNKKYRDSICWECLCECGNIKHIRSGSLRKQNGTKSCGCITIENRINSSKYDNEITALRAKASNYKAIAKQRGLNWNLDIDCTINLLKGNCHYCGSPPSNIYNLYRNRRRKNIKLQPLTLTKCVDIKYNGIDRKDNTIGYEPSNVVSCCKTCNQSKMDKPYDEFINWINNLIEFRKNI